MSSDAQVPAGPGISVEADDLIAQRGRMLRDSTAQAGISTLPGGFLTRKRGNGQIIADSRAYIPGDDIRHVDRGATARTGALHIRTFHEERDRVTFLVADFRPAMLWGMRGAFRSVIAARALAWIGWQAVEAGGRAGLLAVTAAGPFLVPTRGRTAGMLAVIGGLVRAHDAALHAATQGLTDPPLDSALSGLDKVVPRGAEVVLATALDLPGRGFETLIGALSRHRKPRFVLVGDAALNELPAGYYPIASPSGTRRHVRFAGGGTARVAVDLTGYRADHIDAGTATFGALGAFGAVT